MPVDVPAPVLAGPVVEALRSVAGARRVKYVTHPGNGGDALINVGFFDLAQTLGVEYELIPRDATVAGDDVVILAGGGSLVPEYSFATEALERFSRSAGRVIVLPQTIRGIAALIGSLGGNVELFARDHASYRFCREAATAASVALDHDMAFFADMDALLRRRGLRGFAPRPSNFVRLALLAALRVRARFTPTLRAFRVDRESGTPGRGSLATDVSKLCAFGTATVERNLFAAAQFVQAIDRFRAVHTDRLHVAIAAARLGKSTVVHETAQQKCGPVYEMSLKRLGVELAA